MLTKISIPMLAIALATSACRARPSDAGDSPLASTGWHQRVPRLKVSGTELLDPSGAQFLIRGVNLPAAYYFDRSYAAIPLIKQLNFNTVRIVWCADTFEQQGRCEQSHFRPVSDLEGLLAKLREHQLVGVLNLQNVTGLDDSGALDSMVDYLLDPKVAGLLKKNEDLLIVNIANEWYGTWDKSTAYYDAYEGAIKRLRGGGLENVLMIDARGYGQDVASILEDGPKLLEVDSNLLFSAHMYDVFKTNELVEEAVAGIRSMSLPFIVGEFACDHGDRGPVACRKIMQEACSNGAGFGYIGWSWTGNSSDIATLDVVSPDDWQTLSEWGEVLVNSPHGVKAQAREAALPQQSSGTQ